MPGQPGIAAQAISEEHAGRGQPDARPPRGITEHSNLAPLAFGLTGEEQSRRVIDHLYDSADVDFLEAEPFFCHVVLRGLRAVGRMDLALRLIRDRWGRRMVEQGMTSVTEEWNASGSWRGTDNRYVGIFRSLSHAWSGCPAEFLVHQLTGFEVIEPACAVVRLSPYQGEFDYHVVIPTPRGDIEVHCENGRTRVAASEAIEVRIH